MDVEALPAANITERPRRETHGKRYTLLVRSSEGFKGGLGLKSKPGCEVIVKVRLQVLFCGDAQAEYG